MAQYIELPLTDDADALVEVGIDYMQTVLDGFIARPGNVETILLEANAQMGAEVVAQASLFAPVIFAYLGQNLLGIGLRSATSSHATVRFTFGVDALLTVEQGAMVALGNADGNTYVFTLDVAVVSPVGGGTVDVGVTALEPGASANGSTGPGALVDVLDGVSSIVTIDAASGGTDEETDDAYLDRLADAMTILAPRPILPDDHATLARQVDGVGRALAIDLLLPGTSEAPGAVRDPNEPLPAPAASKRTEPRCTTVAITDDSGNAPPSQLMRDVWAALDSAREVNFLNYVIAPTYTVVDVQATVMAYPGFTAADVEAQAEAALADWLNPALYGGTPNVSGELAEGWSFDNTVRLYEAIDYLNRADGLHYVVSVKLRTGANAFAAADIALTGLAPLPRLGVPAVTVQTP
jgi:uncharacterized phage protein gp47/JayE